MPVIKSIRASGAQLSGSLCTFRSFTTGLAQGCQRPNRQGSLNSSRPLRDFHREGTFVDESPALTVVLQAHGGGF